MLFLPALTVVAAEHHRALRGPFFSGPNQDPSYSYLVGSLRLGVHGTTAFFHHPGLPTQGIGAAVLAAAHRASGRQDDLTRDVLSRPEPYLRAVQLTILAAVVSALAAAGFLGRRHGGGVAGVLLQTSPFLGAASLVSLSQVGPESTLVLAAVALSLLVWRFAAAPPGDERAIAAAFGAIAAFAFTTRISALPFVLVPPLLLTTWRGRLVFAAGAAVGSGLALLPIAGHGQDFLDWTLFVGRRTGAWGSPPRDLSDPSLYAEGVATIFRHHPAFSAVLALALAVWIRRWLAPRAGGSRGLWHRALGAVLLGQVAQVLLVSKSPAARYLVPATALAGLALALVWTLLTNGTGWLRGRRRVIAAALLLALPVAVELPRHRAELQRLRQGVEGQREIAAEIARLPRDCAVAEFFRASSLPFALHFGHRMQYGIFSEQLAELYPDELFYNFRRPGFETFAGPVPAAEVERRYSCLALRGFLLPDLASLVIRRSSVEVLYAVPSLDAVLDPKNARAALPCAGAICLNANRFQVDVDWRTAEGGTGKARAVPGLRSNDSGVLYFFTADNWEMLIKVLDGCAVNDRYWVFFGAATDVELKVAVTDTREGVVQRYTSPLGQPADSVNDTAAFATCP